MESILNLNWKLYESRTLEEERYCPNCGKKVLFTDTLRRRQNANGKNLYHFAIYKCPHNHTYNKKIDKNRDRLNPKQYIIENHVDEICYYELMENNVMKLLIHIDVLQKRIRLDQLLSSQITDISRNKITLMIDEGTVLVNGHIVKKKYFLKENDVINIMIK